LEGSSRVNLFVACFSEKPDLLSQWRAYCPSGNGYSIGFEYQQIEHQMNEQEFFLAPCIYDVEEQEKLVREVVGDAFSEIAKNTKPILADISYEFLRKFYSLAPALKHPSFVEEAEWRLISTWPKYISDPRISAREGKSMMLPYFEFKLGLGSDPLPPPEIIVGPNPHMDLAVLAVYFLFGSFTMPVRKTAIPFRGW
jgi:Protein of unknown function (DUF2971)